MDSVENVNVHTRLRTLQPESEYRFELDRGTSLAIKVCSSAVHYSVPPVRVLLFSDA